MNAPHPPVLAHLHTALEGVSLNDKYSLPQGRVLLNGAQALVRLMLMQAERDRRMGLNTAGFVSGYRGSPLGGVDQAFWAARPALESARIHFQPGLNEDLAATAVWGSQQTTLFNDSTVDGVFGLWYGKGPGLDRSLDVFKHANAAGTSPKGGVLLVAGDDHAAKSSTLPHQSDHVLKAAMVPVLFPSSIQDMLDMGLLGYAMSRYAGVWVGFKAVADVVECTETVVIDPQHQSVLMPTDYTLPEGGLNIRWPDSPLEQEARILDHKLYAALAFCRANRINHTVMDCPNARFGIVATGKAYQDTVQALRDLGLTPERCTRLGVRLYKVGMVWPLDALGIREFAQGLREILVVEEKRQWVEYQIKEELYAWREDVRPKVYGKFDERVAEDGREGGEWSIPQGDWLLPSHYELDPALIAKAIARRLMNLGVPPDIQQDMQARLAEMDARRSVSTPNHNTVSRKPYFCSGCPHNTSTQVPEGSRATAGIGCHYMAVWMDRNTHTVTQMGGEGVPWIGQAPFSTTRHVFANLGDGTYFHSGILAIRASIAAGVNITYKILFNDAVAMTGGQPLDGTLTVPRLTRQLAAEGVRRIVLVSDQPDKHRVRKADDPMAQGVEIVHRRHLDRVQRELREHPGTTALVYEQTCASEKRRRRKRRDPSTGLPAYPLPTQRVYINPRVCEGCGDCSKASNCLSVEPLPTPWGVKRTINQSTCNADLSCLEGLCPSLVTVQGQPRVAAGGLNRAAFEHKLGQLPEPNYRIHPDAFNERLPILMVGVGGTGVVTIGAWLSMAAHLHGFSALALDMAGLAQKGGAVYSHLQLARHDHQLASSKIPVGETRVMIAGDLITAAQPQTLELLHDQAWVVVNTDTSPTADFIHDRNWQAPHDTLKADLARALHTPAQLHAVQAQSIALRCLGDAVYANPLLLGMMFQLGALPLYVQGLRRAIELNGVQVRNNLLAFELGRLLVHQPDVLSSLVQPSLPGATAVSPLPETPKATYARLRAELVSYQNEALARQFERLTMPLQAPMERSAQSRLWQRLCNSLFRVLAYKDEFEVARLHMDREWERAVLSGFEPGAKLVRHVAPEWMGASKNPSGGPTVRPAKISLGPWSRPLWWLLARLRGLRGTPLNPFAHSQDAKNQRILRQLFETLCLLMQNDPSMLRHSKQIEAILSLFDDVKGYGQVRQSAFARVINPLRTAVAELEHLEHHEQGRHQNTEEKRGQAF